MATETKIKELRTKYEDPLFVTFPFSGLSRYNSRPC